MHQLAVKASLDLLLVNYAQSLSHSDCTKCRKMSKDVLQFAAF